jgi:hypothetical protein
MKKYFKYKKSYTNASCQELLAVCMISYIELYDYKKLDLSEFIFNSATDKLLNINHFYN